MKRTILVHSGGVGVDGKLHYNSTARLDRAIHLLKRADFLLLTVGKGAMAAIHFTEEEQALANAVANQDHNELMREYALEHAVPPSMILQYQFAKDTVGEIFCGRASVARGECEDITGVLSAFQEPRARTVYSRFFGALPHRLSVVRTVDDDTPSRRAILDAKEARSLGYFTAQFGDVEPGSFPHVREALYREHPLYQNTPLHLRL